MVLNFFATLVVDCEESINSLSLPLIAVAPKVHEVGFPPFFAHFGFIPISV